MVEPLILLAKDLGYKKVAKIEAMETRERYDLLNFALTHSIRGTYAILFKQSSMVQITPYGTNYAISYSQKQARHYLTMHPKLDEKYFREIFTSFEMIIFKICHIFYEDMRHDYTFESQKTSQRLKRLKGLAGFEDWDAYQKLFDEIWYVRDAFAHTFIELNEVCYRQVPLNACFGTTYTGAVYDEVEFRFSEDVEKMFDPLLALFMTRQVEQIDSKKFTALCDAALRPRTLGR
jgi:hypothetical protein